MITMTDDADRATADALVNEETRGYRPTQNYLDQYQYAVYISEFRTTHFPI